MENLISRSSLFFVMMMSMVCDARETLDIETLPTLRSAQYSVEPYKKIVVLSAPRTGSTLAYNVFRFLFEDETNLSCPHDAFNQNCTVLKTHRIHDLNLLKEKNVLFVVTIRNPINAIVSNYRIWLSPIFKIKDFARVLLYQQRDFLIFYEKLKKNGRNVVIIKYEDFEDNLDFFFDLIENHFSITIDDQAKAIIKEGYDKENIYSSTASFLDFKEYLPISGFHGKHVSLEKQTPPDKLLYWINHYLRGVKPIYKKYGYFLE